MKIRVVRPGLDVVASVGDPLPGCDDRQVWVLPDDALHRAAYVGSVRPDGDLWLAFADGSAGAGVSHVDSLTICGAVDDAAARLVEKWAEKRGEVV